MLNMFNELKETMKQTTSKTEENQKWEIYKQKWQLEHLVGAMKNSLESFTSRITASEDRHNKQEDKVQKLLDNNRRWKKIQNK